MAGGDGLEVGAVDGQVQFGRFIQRGERNAEALKALRRNLETTHFAERGRVEAAGSF